MNVDRVTDKPARALVLILAVVGLAACAGTTTVESQPSFYRSLAEGGELDATAASYMISGFRKNHGLGPVTVDPALTRLAEEQAQAMASRDKVDHSVAGEFTQRMRQGGFARGAAVENVSAGYHTLAEAFSGWRDSPSHRANMLLKGATRMGIAAVRAPNSKYKVFWALILAGPDGRG
jgi:uncharacterized protein YkwD